jgi:sugar phosphate isomerase/epimerase
MPIRLSVSNIAWQQNELEDHLKLLMELGCDGVEIAPSCIWKEPANVSNDEIESLKELISKYNLVVPAFHALLFTRPDLCFFAEDSIRQQAVSYLKKLIRLAGMLSVKVLVYGSPASRKVAEKQYDKCYDIAIDVFRELGIEAERNDVFFCIEPLGPSENDFILTADEGNQLVSDVGSKHFGLHLDSKAMVEAGEDFKSVFQRYGAMLKHFHVSEPGLAPPGTSGLDHSLIGKALSRSLYDGFVSIEMKMGFGNTKDVIRDSVAYVRKSYFMI